MKKIDEFTSKVEEFNFELEQLKKAFQITVKDNFINAVKELLIDNEVHEYFTHIAWTQYTPYFNDGEECVFRVNEAYYFLDGEEIYSLSPTKIYSSAVCDRINSIPSYKIQTLKNTIINLNYLITETIDPQVMEIAFGNGVQVNLVYDGNDWNINVEEYDHE